jgi:O-antigen/teichoic acid export membrane protein
MANSIGFGVTAAILTLTWLLGCGLLAAILSYTAGFMARSLIAVGLIGKGVIDKPTELEPGGTRELLRNGVGLMGMNLGQSITYRLDQYLLAALADTRSVGLYAVATTPASLIQVVSNSVGQVAFRDAAENQFGRRKLLVFVLGAAGVTAAYAAVMYVAAPWLIPWVFGPEYASAVDIVRVLVLAEIALSPYLVLSRAVAGAGHIRLSSWTGVVGMVAMGGFLILFIPGNDGLGAAWACVAGYATMSLFLILGTLVIRRTLRSGPPRHRASSQPRQRPRTRQRTRRGQWDHPVPPATAEFPVNTR